MVSRPIPPSVPRPGAVFDLRPIKTRGSLLERQEGMGRCPTNYPVRSAVKALSKEEPAGGLAPQDDGEMCLVLGSGGPKSLAVLPLIDFLDAHPVHVSRIVRCSSFTRSRRAQALRRVASRTRCRSIPFMEIVRPSQGDARNEARDVA